MAYRSVEQKQKSVCDRFPGDGLQPGEAPEDETFSTRFCSLSEADPALVIFPLSIFHFWWQLFPLLYHDLNCQTPNEVLGIFNAYFYSWGSSWKRKLVTWKHTKTQYGMWHIETRKCYMHTYWIYIFALKVTAMRLCGAGLSEIDQVGAIHILSTFSGAAS